MNSSLLPDRERDGFRGPVKTVVDEYSTTVFDRNGKKIEWRGNTSHGRVERTYVYDNNERLIRVGGSSGDHNDEFRYDGQVKTQIRHIAARPDRGPRAFGISVWFDAVSEGEALTDGERLIGESRKKDDRLDARTLARLARARSRWFSS